MSHAINALPQAPLPQRPSSLAQCPFIAGPMITDPRIFVGRQEELHAITTRMTGVQPISINVIGDRRIGKSSLLYHFFQTWEERVAEPSRYVVIYLSLHEAECQHEESFYSAIAQELLRQPSLKNRSDLQELLSAKPLTRQTFSQGIEQWKECGILPVVCLDDFEALLRYRDEFEDGFYDNLRSLMNSSSLMLVIASRQGLDSYRESHEFTSAFFNLGHVLHLEKFAAEEVQSLVQLPKSTVSGLNPILSDDWQQLAKQWGKQHPCVLQLAASFLCQAQHLGKDATWAKQKFQQEQQRLAKPLISSQKSTAALRWLLLSLPQGLGELVSNGSGTMLSVRNWLIGLSVIVTLLSAGLKVDYSAINNTLQNILQQTEPATK